MTSELIRHRSSDIRQNDARPPRNFRGLGKAPAAIPAYQELLLTGMIGSTGGVDVGSPMI